MDSLNQLNLEHIILDLGAGDRFSAYDEMVSQLVNTGCLSSVQHEEVLVELKEREQQTTFAVGRNIAIPHINGANVNSCVFLYARSSEGIEFGSCDTGLIHHLLLVLIPEEEKCGWLKTLAQMARSLSCVDLRETLMELKDVEEVRALLVKNLMCKTY